MHLVVISCMSYNLQIIIIINDNIYFVKNIFTYFVQVVGEKQKNKEKKKPPRSCERGTIIKYKIK